MRFDRRLAAPALLLALCLVAQVALGQGATPGDVEAALEDLMDAPLYERADERDKVVELGDIAVDPLIAEVGKAAETDDANYIVHCIMALGELKEERATEALLGVLSSRNYHEVYSAAMALGSIWAGKGGSGSDVVKAVNAALLALVYSDMPDVGVFGPGQALVSINTIAGIDRPTNMTPDDLRKALSAWANANPNALPPLDDQPWQLGVRIALTTSDAALRSDALQAVREKLELGALEPLVEALGANSGLSGQARTDVARLVGDLSKVAFPVPSTQDLGPAAQVQEWKKAWLAELSGTKDEKHIEYAWRQLESALRKYKEAPSDETAEAVKYFRRALLSQLDGPDQIPASASPAVQDLLDAPLEAKAEISNAMDAVEAAAGQPEKLFEMSRQLNIIQTVLKDNVAVEVGRMYASRLAVVAYTETNSKTAETMGEILSRMTGIPVELGFASIEARQASLKRWADELKRLSGEEVPLPAA